MGREERGDGTGARARRLGEGTEAPKKFRENFRGDLAGLPRRTQQFEDLAVNDLPERGYLEAGPARQMFSDRARLGFPRAADQVSVVDGVGQSGVDGLQVEFETAFAESRLNLGR